MLIDARDRQVILEVRDDGRGFDTTAQSDGFGLTGVQERVFLAGGTVELESGDEGTVLRAHLPKRTAAPEQLSGADQLAS